MYTSMWYTRAESTPRYGFWYCGLGAGQIVGGIISFGAQHAPKEAAFNGWRIMFVVVGAVNVLVSILVFFVLPETPDKARFLTEPERQRIALRLSQDQAGVGMKVFRWRSLLEAFGDLQTCLLVLLTILITIPSGVITTFSSILIKGFGYNSMESALLNMPSGVVSISRLWCPHMLLLRGSRGGWPLWSCSSRHYLGPVSCRFCRIRIRQVCWLVYIWLIRYVTYLSF